VRLDDRPPLVDLGFLEARNASGVCCSRAGFSSPNSWNLRVTAGSDSVSTITALSRAAASFGVPFGTQTPYQSEAPKPGRPASSAVGMSGAAPLRVFDVIANGLIAPAFTCA
jgi:hypothetical protein